MSNHRIHLPALAGQGGLPSVPVGVLKPSIPRNVLLGILRWIGDEVATASLHSQAHLIAAATRVCDEQTKYVEADDRLQTAREASLAHRLGLLNPADEERLEQAEHQRQVGKLRRDAELYELQRLALEARRQALEAEHGLEAAEVFKEDKFKLGRARVAARRRDAEVDKSTAEAAIRKLAQGAPQKPAKGNGTSFNGALDTLLRAVEQEIRRGDADCEDTAELHAELRILEKLRARL